ncbi:MAG: hypothetical protein ACRDDY_07875, partial [Clostridium sp.]|uniref:hypothetical protein n=1 Tax=Clostridium sp. TaxID=1506 RepID=UPI003EE69D2E
NFDEFDSLMENVCPNMSFLKYNKIKNNCINVDQYYDSDYYGGSETINYYTCDIENLYNMLVDFDLIDEDELLKGK